MDNRLYKFIKIILIVIILLVSSLHLLRSIGDPDFFWHLKTGEWIWQNKALPLEDPFSFTTPRIYSRSQHFILTSYWLSQIIYYLIYLVNGFQGIVLLRFFITGILIYTMLERKHGDDVLYMCLLIIFLTQLLEIYGSNDRPQVFSYIFFAVLLFLLERQVKEKLLPTDYWLLPLLMLFWANMHGGHTVGQVTIILYILMEGMKFLHPSLRPVEKKAYKRLLIAGVSGIVFSLVNPNTYHALSMSIPGGMTAFNSEYQSSVKSFMEFNNYNMLLYWFILLLTIIGLIINFKRMDITEVALLAGTGYFSFTTMRFIPFFMIAALPVIGRLFSEKAILKWCRILILLAAIYTALFFTWDERFNIRKLASGKWLYGSSENIGDFIIKNDLKGNMYNHYGYGGYLIWRLAPERKVFIDGRGLDEHIFEHSQIINNAVSVKVAGLPAWKSILNAYNINYIVIPVYDPSGEILRLASTLVWDKDWIPIFFDFYSIIFIKNLPENYYIIKTQAIPKYYLIANIP
ncbi:MAG: hypothetical protein HY754_04720 [Nitrospirae bacterium]|nr:hypothetical protein [Nitrospirota bacterium]